MAETVVSNEIFERVLDGIPSEVRTIVEDGLKAYGKDSATNPSFTDKVKSDRLRKAFDSLSRALIERMEALNENQIFFLCTGALADQISFPGEAPIELLNRDIYDSLLSIFKRNPELPEEMDYILTSYDRARMIALDELVALDPQQSGKRRPHVKEASTEDPAVLREQALGKRNQLVKDLDAVVPVIDKFFEAFKSADMTPGKQAMDGIKEFLNQAAGRSAASEGAAKLDMDRDILSAGDNLKKFAEMQATILLKIRELASKHTPQILELRKTLREIEGLSAVQTDSKRKKFVSFDVDKISLIKRDWGYTAGFVGALAEAAATRVATSGSRILLNAHMSLDNDPVHSQICSPEKVHASMQKILKVHTNLFPRSPSGKPIIPPFIIEPIRNVVDWMDDRFMLALVSGDPMKKGPMFSLDPVEHQVMRACGMYISKDSIYNFRGEQNVGTFMGDYSGKVEKSAKVVFAGADKKMTMVASAKQVDAAGRDTAVADYIDFIFNVLNGLGPNPKMSKRRIAVLLRYVVVGDLQNTVILMLRYAGQTEMAECRESILKHTSNNYVDAKKLVEDSWNDPQIPRILGPKPTQFMQKMFG